MEPSKHLLLHGSIILLVGLLCGAPLGSALVRRRSDDTVRAWRVAHSSLIMGGVLLLAVAGIATQLKLSGPAMALMVWTLVGASYVFAVVLPAAARYGHRGLTAQPPAINRALYFANILGALGLLLGTLVLVWGAYAAL